MSWRSALGAVVATIIGAGAVGVAVGQAAGDSCVAISRGFQDVYQQNGSAYCTANQDSVAIAVGDGSSATALTDSRSFALNGSTAYATVGSVAVARDGSLATADYDSKATATDGSTAKAQHDSTATASDGECVAVFSGVEQDTTGYPSSWPGCAS